MHVFKLSKLGIINLFISIKRTKILSMLISNLLLQCVISKSSHSFLICKIGMDSIFSDHSPLCIICSSSVVCRLFIDLFPIARVPTLHTWYLHIDLLLVGWYLTPISTRGDYGFHAQKRKHPPNNCDYLWYSLRDDRPLSFRCVMHRRLINLTPSSRVEQGIASSILEELTRCCAREPLSA